MPNYVAVCYWANGVHVFENERLDALLASLLSCVHAGMDGYAFGTPLGGFAEAVAMIMANEDCTKSYEDLAEIVVEHIQVIPEGDEILPESHHWEHCEDLGNSLTVYHQGIGRSVIVFRGQKEPDDQT